MKIAQLAVVLLATILWGAKESFSRQYLAEIKVSGTVTDLYGRPLKGAIVEISTLKEKSRLGLMLTDSNGVYKMAITSPPEREYIVTVRLAGFTSDKISTLTANRNREYIINFGLAKDEDADVVEQEIHFVITDNTRKLLENVKVTIFCPFNPSIRGEGWTYSTPEAIGKWVWRYRQGGQYIVYFLKPGYEIVSRTLILKFDRDKPNVIEVSLPPLN